MTNKQTKLLNLFIKYASVDTRSEPKSTTTPSTSGQVRLIEMIEDDLIHGGVKPYQMSILADHSMLVYIPATEPGAVICLTAHVDTYFGIDGGAKPIIYNYEGDDIVLPFNNKVISALDLAEKKGNTIVTADGSTTLGADDKSGVAILVQLILDITNSEMPNHGNLYFWFCVDEEIDRMGLTAIPPQIVNSWDMMITVDGDDPKNIAIGCFNGGNTTVEFNGNDAHPGDAGDHLKSASYAAARLVIELEDNYNVPWTSKGEDGFIYAPKFVDMTPTHSEILFIPRDFEIAKMKEYHCAIVETTQKMAKRYGVEFEISGKELSYLNINPAISPKIHLLKHLTDTLEKIIMSKINLCTVRFGTCGSSMNLVYPALPVPDVGTGGYNVHGYEEFLVFEEMFSIYLALKEALPKYLKFE